MSMIKDPRISTSSAADLAVAPGATHERILRVLGLTRRPLQSGEI